MPTYVYYCPQCGQEFEIVRPWGGLEDTVKCEQGHEAQRKLTPPAVIFKGEGWTGAATKPRKT